MSVKASLSSAPDPGGGRSTAEAQHRLRRFSPRDGDLRNGHVRRSDGLFDTDLALPEKMGCMGSPQESNSCCRLASTVRCGTQHLRESSAVTVGMRPNGPMTWPARVPWLVIRYAIWWCRRRPCGYVDPTWAVMAGSIRAGASLLR